MAAELTTTKLNAESHLLLDQSLLRLPHELVRKTFKASQREVEHTQKIVLTNLKSTAEACLSKKAEVPETLASLDSMITRMQGLKRKLEGLREEEKAIHQSSRKRIQHLQDLYEIPSLVDVKYDEWSRIRLNRLLVDYLLRSGYQDSAKALAKEKGIEDLVDTEVFMQCNRIQESLKKGRTAECLTWCSDNKQALKKMNNNLEFEVRLQQYVELVRTGEPDKLLEATQHARKYLAPHKETKFLEIHRAAGLLAFPPNTTAEPYRSLYSRSRWTHLSNLFLTTHHNLVSLPARPLLHIALSAGLSSLKTPSCHASYPSSTVASSTPNPHATTSPSSSPLTSTSANKSAPVPVPSGHHLSSICPICSTELKDLARNVPYAHHTKSYVESDPVVLPNGRIYGRDSLVIMSPDGMGMGVSLGASMANGHAESNGTSKEEGKVRDPVTGELFAEGDVHKVYIS